MLHRYGYFRLIPVVLLSVVLASCNRLATFDFGDAPDPSYPTQNDDGEPEGPAVTALDGDGEFLTAVILGECVTVETEPENPDRCDDSDPAGNISAQTIAIKITRTGLEAEGDYWANVALDMVGDGRWDPESEWVVRNCSVPAAGPDQETIVCDATGSSLAPAENGWLRVMLTDQQAPSGGWDGSAFFEAGEAKGEVEDYSKGSVATPVPPPTPIPTATPLPTATPDPSEGGESFLDPIGDAQVMDDEGNFPGIALPEDRSDIREVRVMWLTEDDQDYLVLWIFREKSERSNSSAVQAFLTVGQDTLVRVIVWEDHEEQVTFHVFGEEGEITDSGASVEVLENGGQVHFKIPADQVGEADSFIVRSFDRLNSGDQRGFDSTEYFSLPAR